MTVIELTVTCSFLSFLSMKIQEWYDQEMSHLEEVQKNLSEDYWIPCLEVDGARQPHIVRYIMQKKLRPLTDNRLSLFER